MLYWPIVFLILAWGAAILGFGSVPGPLVWIAKILAIGFMAAFIVTASSTLRTQWKHLRRGSRGRRDLNADRKHSVSAGNQA